MKKRSTNDYQRLIAFLQRVRSYTGKDLIFGPAAGEALYHYTDLSGMKAILDTDDLWLTHSRYLNDDEEITHGYRIVKTVIEEERKNAKPGRAKFLDGLFDLVKEPSEEGVYICSFCLKDNLLSQWRGYGANGTGVSLKFEPAGFKSFMEAESGWGLMRLWKVFYPEAKQKGIIREAINFAYEAKGALKDRTYQAAYAIQFFIPTFKNAGFEEENECRLIFTPAPGLSTHPQFRVARGMLIPYFSLKQLWQSSTKLPLTGVLVGPSANKTLNVGSTRMVLDQTGHENVPVEVSKTSFRGL